MCVCVCVCVCVVCVRVCVCVVCELQTVCVCVCGLAAKATRYVSLVTKDMSSLTITVQMLTEREFGFIKLVVQFVNRVSVCWF